MFDDIALLVLFDFFRIRHPFGETFEVDFHFPLQSLPGLVRSKFLDTRKGLLIINHAKCAVLFAIFALNRKMSLRQDKVAHHVRKNYCA